jgi:DNA-binding MarR family transcriptional regulator
MPRPRHDPPSLRAAGELARVAPLVARWIERRLAAHDPPLTVTQLLVLEAAAAGGVGGAELARSAAVTPAAVSQLVGGLEAAGLLERMRVEDDRRRQTLVLTAEGRSALRSARLALRRGLEPLLAPLPPREADALADGFARLGAALGAAPPPRRPSRPGPPPPRPPRPR